MLEKPVADPILDFRYSVAKLLRHRLSFQSFDCVRIRGSGHNDKCDNRHVRSRLLQAIVQSYIQLHSAQKGQLEKEKN